MAIADIIDLFRAEVNDVDTPQLWPDQEVYAYLNDAQKMFCRLTGGLPDSSTPEVTRLTVTANHDNVPLSRKILKIRDAYRTSDGAPIDLINYEDFPLRGLRFDGTTGPITSLVLGMETGKARIYPVPSVADTAQLIVDRLPLRDITIDSADDDLEIDDQHWDHLTLWMRHRAYAKQDAQTYDKTKSATFKADFEAYCARATTEKARAKHKTRIVAYGGL